MRFLNLDLLAYGHFDRKTLAFLPDGPSLHVLHGPNEAGKSTTLRAITGFLYGIERATIDSPRSGSDLQIGARIQHSSGQERYLVRRKTTGGSLFDESGRAVPEAHLSDWLSVHDRKQFEAMFGLSHESLRKAGDALASSKHAAAEALFSAALDGASLRSTMVKLQEEAEAILTPAGQGGTLVKAVRRYRELRDTERKAEKPSAKWRQHQTELASAVEAVRFRDEEVKALRSRNVRLERIRKSLEPLRRRAVLREQREAMGSVRLLALDVGERRRQLIRDQDEATLLMDELKAKLARAQQERDELVVPEALLLFVPRRRAFNERLGAYKKELADRPGLVHEILPYRREAEELLRQLGYPDLPIDDVGQLKLGPKEVERVRKLHDERLSLQSERQSLLARLVETEAELARRSGTLVEPAPTRHVASLRALWERSDDKHDVDQQLRILSRNLESVALRVTDFARTLGLGDADVCDLVRHHVPPEHRVRAAEQEIAASVSARSQHEARRLQVARDLEAARRALAAYVGSRPVPSIEQLREARSQRDLLWSAMRQACSSGTSGTATWPGEHGDVPLTEALTLAMQQTDALADALWAESSRIEQHAHLKRTVDEGERQLEELGRASLVLDSAEADCLARWGQLWEAADIEPPLPHEMSSWRAEWERFVAAANNYQTMKEKLEVLESEAAVLRSSVVAALAMCGVPCAADLPWPTLRALIEQTITQAQLTEREQAIQATEVERLSSTVARLRGLLAQKEERLSAWQVEWSDATRKMRATEPLEPGAASLVLDLHTRLFEATGQRDRLEKRIKAIDKNIAAFQQELAENSESMGLELEGNLVGRAETLLERVTDAELVSQRREALVTQIAGLEAELDTAASRQSRATTGLMRLFEETGCEDVEALEVAEERSSKARVIEDRLAEAERLLSDLGEGWSVHELETAAAGTDSDQVREELATIEAELQAKEEERAAAHRTVGELRERDNQYTAGDDAAHQFEEMQAQAETIRSLAGRFAQRRVASLVLQRAMARYQEESQTQILKRAEQLFVKLTCGRYTGLRVEYEGDGATIRCLRGSQAVQVRERVMSDGTLDQLYLALRLASIEQQLSFQEPMPLVLDDIFIHFDDERAQAGIEVLAEFAQKTQVLLLTHHSRTLELATQALSPGAWQTIRLERPAVV